MTPNCLELRFDSRGWCSQVNQMPSPNFDARPPGTVTSLLVIHNISLPPGQFGGGWITDFFLNRLNFDAHPYFDQLRNLRVSAHFLIRRDGELVQFVSTDDRAWHAGLSTFSGRDRCNDFSIGVELGGTDTEPFTPQQYHKLATLTGALRERYPLTDVTGHEHIAPERKTDPGPFFDWNLYRSMLPPAKSVTSASLRFPGTLLSC
jgi:N-acetyl-anhydromuramoyl-L-alanine amidase